MITWEAHLSNGEVAIEGTDQWIETPGDFLPWRKLCEYTNNYDLFIEELIVHLDDRNKLVLSNNSFYSIETRLEIENALSGGNMTEHMVVIAHDEEETTLYSINKETHDIIKKVVGSFKPMCPSNPRK